ncbi:DNA-3-methyladenine glycosylase I [Granulicatella sp. zg-ZJ]|nr:DNA-3-methyladenine glycosylase I [Granulicatella sp. zg-ZJ]
MNMTICDWALHSTLENVYHDTEWGIPKTDDQELFELLILEGMQAGLSWHLILKRRENMRQILEQFDYHKLAMYTDEQLDMLLQDTRLIRNKLKIYAIRTNAQCFLQIQKDYGSFARYIWKFVDYQPIQNKWATIEQVPCFSSLSDKISKELKKRGFKFIGTKIIYSFLQASGMINDHLTSCPCYSLKKYDRINLKKQ